MVAKQERSQLTRDRLVRAASDAFAQQGFAGTSLQDVCRGADVSMGALTFHFSKKSDLAAAVAEAGAQATRQTVEDILRTEADPLTSAVALTCALVDLLTENSSALATTQLARTGSDWDDAWLPAVRLLLQEAKEQCLIDSEVEIEKLVRLASLLVHGSAYTLRSVAQEGDRATELAHIWAAVLHGIAAPATHR
ncbi:TetR/AcrR family transcriptional regulator [Streptomyces sp. T-3]|nr:TetR/AcrR family transcriptional regulator [Streptomyces sp. T-3]